MERSLSGMKTQAHTHTMKTCPSRLSMCIGSCILSCIMCAQDICSVPHTCKHIRSGSCLPLPLFVCVERYRTVLFAFLLFCFFSSVFLILLQAHKHSFNGRTYVAYMSVCMCVCIRALYLCRLVM